jgi:tetratricopeptide (TPR) repeat protein
MKTTNKLFLWLFMLSLFLPVFSEAQQVKSEETNSNSETYYYAVEINGVICGYSESNKTIIEKDGKELLLVKDDIVVKLSVLGGALDMTIKNLYQIDPATEKYIYSEHEISAGAVIQTITKIEGDTAYFSLTTAGETKEIEISPEIILETPISYPHLMRDFITGDEQEKSYRVFDDMTGEIIVKNYKRIGDEELELAGKTYNVTVFEELNQNTGTKIKLWLNSENSFPVKFDISGRVIYLADKSVKKMIKTVDLENLLFARVNKVIPDVQNISYMKLNATIESSGEWLTPENLNFPGQSFSGTVTNNLIEGVFEINPRRYDGSNAPDFPFDYILPDSLQKYLEPESLIESDNPVLINEAKKITSGSEDSWEAAKRLSKWVAENIEGAIPGGTSAINTYNTRQGECGSHSRLLAAFCRSVGIPARLSIGCMYTTHYGGSFGQHAWTEVYMGDAGWIPVDATAFEIDYIDAGHIRLGEKTSFNPKSMEILEYRVGDEDLSNINNVVPELYESYLGKYTNLENNNVLNVYFQDGSVTVDIAGKIVLALNEPDDEGLWWPKITKQANFSFIKNESDKVKDMRIQEIINLPKKSGLDSKGEDVPENLQPYLGKYILAQLQAEFTVMYKDGGLLVDDPLNKIVVKLQPPDDKGKWVDEFNKNSISFQEDEEGKISGMTVYANTFLPKGELVSSIVGEVIEQEGIEDGIKKYQELKEDQTSEYIFSERGMNALGYKLLGNNKTSEAIEIFKLNVEAYPESWNVYDSMGEAYMKNGDKKLAKRNYKKSLKLNPENENGINMLEKIKKSK